MIIKTLAELQQPDETSLLFSPLGVGAKMRPQDAADFQQRVIAQYALSSQVPETTRQSFERVQNLYSYGVLCYDFFTVAGDYTRLVVEQALRDRFLPFYGGTATFADQQGKPQPVTAETFDALYRAIRRPDGRPRGWKLQLASGHQPIAFNGEFTSLLRWARAEGLLGGQRDRVRDRPRIELRNFAARVVMAVGWDDRTVTWSRAEVFSPERLNDSASFALVRADPDDRLASYDSRYETSRHPCDYLWGPGSWQDARAWLDTEQPGEDEVTTLDRLFMLRYHERILFLPQTVSVAAGLPDDDQRDGTWYLIRADNPVDAFSHQRQSLAEVSGGHTTTGHCLCPVETVGQGTWKEVMRMAAAAGAEVTARPVPDFRVSISRMPRCNEITGPGQWTIPAECW